MVVIHPNVFLQQIGTFLVYMKTSSVDVDKFRILKSSVTKENQRKLCYSQTCLKKLRNVSDSLNFYVLSLGVYQTT